jgi:hypothetical protein
MVGAGNQLDVYWMTLAPGCLGPESRKRRWNLIVFISLHQDLGNAEGKEFARIGRAVAILNLRCSTAHQCLHCRTSVCEIEEGATEIDGEAKVDGASQGDDSLEDQIGLCLSEDAGVWNVVSGSQQEVELTSGRVTCSDDARCIDWISWISAGQLEDVIHDGCDILHIARPPSARGLRRGGTRVTILRHRGLSSRRRENWHS